MPAPGTSGPSPRTDRLRHIRDVDRTELAALLRQARDRVRPVGVGLPAGTRRQVPDRDARRSHSSRGRHLGYALLECLRPGGRRRCRLSLQQPRASARRMHESCWSTSSPTDGNNESSTGRPCSALSGTRQRSNEAVAAANSHVGRVAKIGGRGVGVGCHWGRDPFDLTNPCERPVSRHRRRLRRALLPAVRVRAERGRRACRPRRR